MQSHKAGEKKVGYMPEEMEYIITQSGKIAYNRVSGKSPGVVFFCGHGSDKEGGKAMFIEAWAKNRGQAFLRFDYSGHGSSDGLFLETNISDWTRDAITVLDNLTEGSQILVGSSLGGWIMLNVAVERPNRVAGLIGIAAAPDFTEDLIWQPLDESSRSIFKTNGHIAMENPYADDPVVYPYHLIEDGRRHLRLRVPLSITQPVRLLHGINDREVPWQTALALTDCLQSNDVLLHFDKAATHRFSEPAQLQSIQSVLEQLINQIQHKPSN